LTRSTLKPRAKLATVPKRGRLIVSIVALAAGWRVGKIIKKTLVVGRMKRG
jgi:hypothetical protein